VLQAEACNEKDRIELNKKGLGIERSQQYR
jgi:hypothetical protein